jgi:hypothetical protein
VVVAGASVMWPPATSLDFRQRSSIFIDKYLGVNIKQIDVNAFELSQPFLIEQITTVLGIADGKINEKLTPMGKPLLNKDLQGVPRKYDWEYHGAIGMLTARHCNGDSSMC